MAFSVLDKGHYHEEIVGKDLLKRLERAARTHSVSVKRLSKDKGKTLVAISSDSPDLSAFWQAIRASE